MQGSAREGFAHLCFSLESSCQKSPGLASGPVHTIRKVLAELNRKIDIKQIGAGTVVKDCVVFFPGRSPG